MAHGPHYKNLGQVNPSVDTETLLYECPADHEAVISSIIVCNQDSFPTTFRVSVAVGGEITDPKDYIYFDLEIPGNDTFIATIGLTLEPTDEVRVYAGSGDLSFSAWGTEIS